MRKSLQSVRWSDFRRRADHAPEAICRHRPFGWEYIPVHPFGDERELLLRLGIEPPDYWGVDAWWGVNEDATLLESIVAKMTQYKPGLYARKTEHEEGWVYLRAVFKLPFITRQAFEAAMGQFIALGFPEAELFDLPREQQWVWLGNLAGFDSSPPGTL